MSGINRFLSRRDKHHRWSHNKDSNPHEVQQEKPRATSGHLHGLFSDFEENVSEKDVEQKIKALSSRLSKLGISTFKAPDIEYVLNTNYARGDPEKAFDLLVLLEDSEEGIIKEYKPEVKLLGAVNRRNVTCYLDATLFAMFARLDSFEAILYNPFEDEQRKRLATLLRLWVNSLRVGKLITTDITKQIQDAIANCGWKEAAEIHQQDASEAFSFITETLELPMLTLKMDIFHTGKEDANDDHKFVQERLLEVSIPEEPADGGVITLEDCLEMYFNSRIEVKRYMERRATLNSTRSRSSTDNSKGFSVHVEVAEGCDSLPSTPTSTGPQSPLPPYSPLRATVMKARTPSIIQEHYISEKDDEGPSQVGSSGVRRGRPRAGSIKKEVMMPAWQFFSLIPWYTDTLPNSDAQVAAHFSSKRPILGICLKRYSVLANGQAVRRSTHIDIPTEIALPHFIHDDNDSPNASPFGNFKLSLQSVVCHRGVSVSSGHYISLVRGKAPPSSPSASTNSSEDLEDQWLIFDDLAKERVCPINIEQALKAESPYLLFYQVQPIEGDPGNIAAGKNPPIYSLTNPDSITSSEPTRPSISSRDTKSSLTDSSGLVPGRPSFEGAASESLTAGTSLESERRMSIAFADTSFTSPLRSGDGNKTPASMPRTVSRRGSKSGRSKSRPASQTGEGRLGASLTRLAGRLGGEKSDSSLLGADAGEVGSEGLGVEAGEKGKVRKEKERGRNWPGAHQRLSKGKGREKPERECVVM